jgi:LysR family transcriptional activator of nhaA
MSTPLNYRHLYYFWVVATAGGVARAAAQLNVAVQTVSAQVRELERALGHALFKPAGRGLALTEAGQAALRQAEHIFQLGAQLPAVVRDAAAGPTLRFAVGVVDTMPKLAIWHLLRPVLAEPGLRLLCHDDEYERLLGDLALHRLDLVLADRAPAGNPNLKLYSHALPPAPLAWYAPAALYAQARRGFPVSLARVPVLLPTAQAAVRLALDRWFERHGLRPLVAGEFEDSALLKTFGAAGLGVFAAPRLIEAELTARYRVRRVGECDGVAERFFAIGTERKVQHPLIRRVLSAGGSD